MRRILVLTCSVGLLLAVSSPAAMAAPRPQPVTIESSMQVSLPAHPNAGWFDASGSGLICATGTVADTRYVWDLPDHLLVDKTFSCADGLVFFRLQVHHPGDPTPVDETFTWTILGGTDAYAGLHGHGSGTTEPTTDGVINHYTGFLIG